MASTAISEYIYLSKLFGACVDYVQATGGNISVKTDHEIIIKKSGFPMAETSLGKGYVICSLDSLKDKKLSVESSILSGDLPGKPSMELFFHLLPAKYIIHIHPTVLMRDLCSYNFGRLRGLFTSALFVPYFQPGHTLGDYIFKHYSSEHLIFLENHGVIFLADSISEILQEIHSTFELYSRSFSDILFIHSLYSTLGREGFIKPSYLLPRHLASSIIHRYTPDFHLFLGPAVWVFNEETLEDYKQKWDKLPVIAFYNNMYYILGSTSKSAEFIEQMFFSYINANFESTCIQIEKKQQETLETDPNEKERLVLFKA